MYANLDFSQRVRGNPHSPRPCLTSSSIPAPSVATNSDGWFFSSAGLPHSAWSLACWSHLQISCRLKAKMIMKFTSCDCIPGLSIVQLLGGFPYVTLYSDYDDRQSSGSQVSSRANFFFFYYILRSRVVFQPPKYVFSNIVPMPNFLYIWMLTIFQWIKVCWDVILQKKNNT